MSSVHAGPGGLLSAPCPPMGPTGAYGAQEEPGGRNPGPGESCQRPSTPKELCRPLLCRDSPANTLPRAWRGSDIRQREQLKCGHGEPLASAFPAPG